MSQNANLVALRQWATWHKQVDIDRRLRRDPDLRGWVVKRPDGEYELLISADHPEPGMAEFCDLDDWLTVHEVADHVLALDEEMLAAHRVGDWHSSRVAEARRERDDLAQQIGELRTWIADRMGHEWWPQGTLLELFERIVRDFSSMRHQRDSERLRADKTEKQFREAQSLLESLTVGGSEFHNNPHRCAEFVREKYARGQKHWNDLIAAKRELRLARRQLDQPPVNGTVGTGDLRSFDHAPSRAGFVKGVIVSVDSINPNQYLVKVDGWLDEKDDGDKCNLLVPCDHRSVFVQRAGGSQRKVWLAVDTVRWTEDDFHVRVLVEFGQESTSGGRRLWVDESDYTFKKAAEVMEPVADEEEKA